MTYASVDAFRRAFAGSTVRLDVWLPMPSDQQDIRLAEALQMASYRIDRALGLAGYATPVVFGSGGGEVNAPNLQSTLSETCIALAFESLAPSLSAMPDDLKEMAARAADFLTPGGSAGAISFDPFGRLRPINALVLPGLPRVA